MKGIVRYDRDPDPLTESGYYIKSADGDLYAIHLRCDLMAGDRVEFIPSADKESRGLPYATRIELRERVSNVPKRA